MAFRPAERGPDGFAGRHDLEVVVVCQEGYTSSLAAAALQDIGLHRATGLDGGFVALGAAGLPVASHASDVGAR